MGQSKMREIVSWILAVLLALMFLAAGAGKFSGPTIEMFANWGYSAWFATLIGILEIAGAIGLLIPKTTRSAAMGLIGIMIGASYTHLANGEGLQVLRPIIFMVALVTLWWLRSAGKGQGRAPADG